MLPGPTGQAIMSGNLPHTLLLSKEGMVIGNVPMLGKKQSQDQGNAEAGPNGGYMTMGGANQGPPTPPMAPMPNMQVPYGYAPNMQVPHGYVPNMQIPHGYVPPMQIPHGYVPPMQQFNHMQPMPYPMPVQRPGQIAYQPMSSGGYGYYYDPRMAIWQAQAPGGQPFSTIPGFAPNIPPTPQTPPTPMMPIPPGGPMAPMPYYGPMPNNGFNQFTPMPQMTPMQPMGPPMSPMSPLQLPRMEGKAPPQIKVGGNAYPTHPFVRSPRDFFMWGENMLDEERARRRPFPVP
jgi:hypothetical protein